VLDDLDPEPMIPGMSINFQGEDLGGIYIVSNCQHESAIVSKSKQNVQPSERRISKMPGHMDNRNDQIMSQSVKNQQN
jgi:hypothetical protein